MNPTLAELILATKDRNEYSYESLAKACGGVPGAGRLHQLATKEQKTFPDPETINGLARGCKVAPLEVIKAAARSLSLSVSDDAADNVYMHGYDLLPGNLKSTIQDLGEQVAELARKAGEGNADSSPSMNQAGGKPATGEDDGLGAFGHRDRGDLDHENQNDGAGDNVRQMWPDLDTMAADTTGETIKQKLDKEAADRGEEDQTPPHDD